MAGAERKKDRERDREGETEREREGERGGGERGREWREKERDRDREVDLCSHPVSGTMAGRIGRLLNEMMMEFIRLCHSRPST